MARTRRLRLVQRVVDHAILWPLRSATGVQSRGADDAPTDLPRLAGQDEMGTEGYALTPASPSECHPRPNPASASAFAEYQATAHTAVPLEQIMQSTTSRVGCSIRFRRCSCRPGIGPVRWPKPCGITSTATRRTSVSKDYDVVYFDPGDLTLDGEQAVEAKGSRSR